MARVSTPRLLGDRRQSDPWTGLKSTGILPEAIEPGWRLATDLVTELGGYGEPHLRIEIARPGTQNHVMGNFVRRLAQDTTICLWVGATGQRTKS